MLRLSQGVSGESGPAGGPGSTGDEVKFVFSFSLC